MVCIEDVARGKPFPDPYVEGARRLGVDAREIAVFEDAPAGVTAAKAAGMTVVAVATTHDATELVAADHVVRDLSDVRPVRADDGRIGLTLLPDHRS
jgi:sugar-phosphatase